MSFTYYAPNLNRTPNTFYIPGNDLPRESFFSTAIFNYRRGGGVSWASVRSATTSTVNSGVSIQNDFNGVVYTLARTGVQFSTDWGVVPVGMSIAFTLDGFSLPIGGILKIQAFKGTSTALTGNSREYTIPLDEGLIPYSNEVEVDGITAEGSNPVLYFNQRAINDFLANPDQNLFILGEYDYNNIAPTDRYAASDSQFGTVGLVGQT
jgi:hypothetical protein